MVIGLPYNYTSERCIGTIAARGIELSHQRKRKPKEVHNNGRRKKHQRFQDMEF